ncbi:MAG TPA: site-specific integrase [Xanthobacteraceae bacterium]|nr:site-specific integrase [Xanthobacteraceae bacterium]
MIGVHYVRAKGPAGHRWYIYAWRGGPRIGVIEGGPKPRLSRELEQRVKEERDRAGAAGDGTLSGMIRDWRRSPEWEGLSPNTRDTWTPALTRIEDKWGKYGVELWNDPRMVGKVVEWRDSQKAKPRAADIGVTVLSRLLEWGRLRAKVSVNVASGIPQLYRGADRAEIIWTDEDIAAFCRSALMLDRPLLIDCLFLATLTGMRLADLAALTFEECGTDAIVRKALKRSRGRRRRAAVPILPQLRELIEELRTRPRAMGVETLLVNSYGRPWSADALGKRFGEISRHAGIVYREAGEEDRPKHLHDVRGTFVTHLCRAGLTDREIADIVAWSETNVGRIRRVYVDDAAVVVAIGRRINTALQAS